MHIFIHAYKRVGMFLVIQFYVQWTNHEVKSFRSSSGQYSRFYCNVWVVRVRITYYLTLRSLPLLYNQPYSLTWLKVSFLLSLFTNHTESLPHSRVHTYSQCFFFFHLIVGFNRFQRATIYNNIIIKKKKLVIKGSS